MRASSGLSSDSVRSSSDIVPLPIGLRMNEALEKAKLIATNLQKEREAAEEKFILGIYSEVKARLIEINTSIEDSKSGKSNLKIILPDDTESGASLKEFILNQITIFKKETNIRYLKDRLNLTEGIVFAEEIAGAIYNNKTFVKDRIKRGVVIGAIEQIGGATLLKALIDVPIMSSIVSADFNGGVQRAIDDPDSRILGITGFKNYNNNSSFIRENTIIGEILWLHHFIEYAAKQGNLVEVVEILQYENDFNVLTIEEKRKIITDKAAENMGIFATKFDEICNFNIINRADFLDKMYASYGAEVEKILKAYNDKPESKGESIIDVAARITTASNKARGVQHVEPENKGERKSSERIDSPPGAAVTALNAARAASSIVVVPPR
jgi:hypothetical protein